MLGVSLDQIDLLVASRGLAKETQGLIVDREEAHRRSVFRSHVGDRRPVRQPDAGESPPAKLDELAHHALGPEGLCDRQDQVGGCRPFGQLAGQAETDDLGQQHVDGLAEHHRLGLDTPNAPSDHAQPVDHRRVAVRAHHAVRHRHHHAVDLAHGHDVGQVLQVDLVDDARGGRHHAKPVKRLLTPTEELVPFEVALELTVGVDAQGIGRAERIHLNRMVDDQVDRHEGVDSAGVPAEHPERVAHGGQVDHGRHAGEILEQHAGGDERDLARPGRSWLPPDQRLHVILGDGEPVDIAQGAFQQHPNAVREPIDAGPRLFRKCL